MKDRLMTAMLDFAEEAGSIALAEQSDLQAELKPDETYVTEVDMQVSELAFQRFAEHVPKDCIVTEEHVDNLTESAGRVESADGAASGSNDSDLLLVVDPIDGTRNYFHNMPLYGISVGVLRGLKPWLGVVTFPALNEMFVCTGSEAFVLLGAYGSKPKRRALARPDEDGEVAKNSQILLANGFARKYRWSYDVCTTLLTACVTVNSCWPVFHRGIGSVFVDHLWDIAGAWPLLQLLGFELRGSESGRLIDEYRPSDYDPETRRVREPVIVSRPAHFDRLREGIIKL